jgi:hypothetical protein
VQPHGYSLIKTLTKPDGSPYSHALSPNSLAYPCADETANPACRLFLDGA